MYYYRYVYSCCVYKTGFFITSFSTVITSGSKSLGTSESHLKSGSDASLVPRLR